MIARTVCAGLIICLGVPSFAAAQAAPMSKERQVSNEDVRNLCVEIVHREAGHPLRDCMSSVDMFLERNGVPRSQP